MLLSACGIALLGAFVAKLVGAVSLGTLLLGAFLPFALLGARVGWAVWRSPAVAVEAPDALFRVHADHLELDGTQVLRSCITGFRADVDGVQLLRSSHEPQHIGLPGWDPRGKAVLLRWLSEWRFGQRDDSPYELQVGDTIVWIDDRPLVGCVGWVMLLALSPPLFLGLCTLAAQDVWPSLFVFIGIVAGAWMVFWLFVAAAWAFVEAVTGARTPVELVLEGDVLTVTRRDHATRVRECVQGRWLGVEAREHGVWVLDLDGTKVVVRPPHPEETGRWLERRNPTKAGSFIDFHSSG